MYVFSDSLSAITLHCLSEFIEVIEKYVTVLACMASSALFISRLIVVGIE